MSMGSSIAVYFVIWWITLFAVLPFGVRSQIEEGKVSPGTDPGAPARTRMGVILIANTLVAAIAYWVFVTFLLPGL